VGTKFTLAMEKGTAGWTGRFSISLTKDARKPF